MERSVHEFESQSQINFSILQQVNAPERRNGVFFRHRAFLKKCLTIHQTNLAQDLKYIFVCRKSPISSLSNAEWDKKFV